MTFKQRQLMNHWCFDLAGDDVVFITGSGRSGTSWLANICNYQNDFRYLFEPLNPSNLSINHCIQWSLPSHAASPVLDAMLLGKISNKWVNSRNKRFFAKRRLIKEIRSNWMLPWINKHYPKTKVVMIIRNPLDVAASRKALSQRDDNSQWVWLPSLEELLKEKSLIDALNKQQFEALYAQIGNGIVMETVADWCINNLLILNQPERQSCYVVYYEELINDGVEVAKRLLNYIGVSISENLEQTLLQRSETSRSNLGTQWRDVLTDQEYKQIVNLLALFDIQKLYTDDWQPVVSNEVQSKVANA